MKQYIQDILVNLYKTCSTDKYGQVSKFNCTSSIFGDKLEEVKEYCNNSITLGFSTYGGRFGEYEAFTILDPDLRLLCRMALESNPNFIRNITKY